MNGAEILCEDIRAYDMALKRNKDLINLLALQQGQLKRARANASRNLQSIIFTEHGLSNLS